MKFDCTGLCIEAHGNCGDWQNILLANEDAVQLIFGLPALQKQILEARRKELIPFISHLSEQTELLKTELQTIENILSSLPELDLQSLIKSD